MKFIKTNPHPTGKKIGDCVVRAIAIAETKRWLDVYDALCEVGRTLHDLPNGKRTYEKYLLDSGWEKHKMPKHPNGKRYRLSQLADEYGKGEIIVRVANHVATIVDGDLYDTWDCSHKSVCNFYTR